MSKAPKAAVETTRNRQGREKATALQASADNYAQHIVESLFYQIDNSTKTLAEVARGSGVTASTLEKWKRGALHPTLAEITKCFAYLGWTLRPQYLRTDASEGIATTDEDCDAAVAELLTAYHLCNGLFAPDRKAFDEILKETDARLCAEAASDQDRLFGVFEECMRRASALTYVRPHRTSLLAAETAAKEASKAIDELTTELVGLFPRDTADARSFDIRIDRIVTELSIIRSELTTRLERLGSADEDRKEWRKAHGSTKTDTEARGHTEFHRGVLSILAGFYELAFAPNEVPAGEREGPFMRFVRACYSEMHAIVDQRQRSKTRDDALEKWEMATPTGTIRSRLVEPRAAWKATRPWPEEPPVAKQYRAHREFASMLWRARCGV
jgi:hypothetical protein